MPLEDFEISETQRVMRLQRVYVQFYDLVIREACMGWAIDLEDGSEVFAAAMVSPAQPVLVCWSWATKG